MKVSAVIPFYNRIELLRDSIGSVLAQTRPADEIILVDDGSPEDSSWIPVEFPMAKIVRLPKNMGPKRARYEGVAAATGTHVATLDADDTWYPQKLEKQIAFVEETDDPRGLYTHQQWVHEGESGVVRPRTALLPEELVGDYYYVRNESVQTSSFFMDRTVYLELARISEDYYAEDMELVLEVEAHQGRVYVQEEVLSQWNCIVNPLRHSSANNEAHFRQFLSNQGHHLSPKAQAAFKGRALAGSLLEQGRYGAAFQLMGEALRIRALSPKAVAKITLFTLFPRPYKIVAGWTQKSRQSS